MAFSPEDFPERLERVRERIRSVANTAGRSPDSVRILPVTKTLPASAVCTAVAAGLDMVGENRVQEAVAKMKEVDLRVSWELIGHLQSNKVRLAVEHFDRIQSVDTITRIEQINRHAAEADKRMAILIQVNAGRDPAKFGADLSQAPALLERALSCTNLRIDGLMTIAPLSDDPEVARHTFARLRSCRDSLEQRFGCRLAELSMGMSDDFESAVREGSTLLRLGSVLFGPR
ncbi:MAG: YggS family pyridoxal phosphate-dependent enzyme [Verrucomicrobia bacterium]|nr:MAG: YggS family pyridoxal phosphate-dependent enzyme [Verrucomicrobiota bacterium]